MNTHNNIFLLFQNNLEISKKIIWENFGVIEIKKHWDWSFCIVIDEKKTNLDSLFICLNSFYHSEEIIVKNILIEITNVEGEDIITSGCVVNELKYYNLYKFYSWYSDICRHNELYNRSDKKFAIIVIVERTSLLSFVEKCGYTFSNIIYSKIVPITPIKKKIKKYIDEHK